MSSSLMFKATIAWFLLFAGSAQAKECYELVDDPANSGARWTIAVNDDSTLTWRKGGETVELDTSSAGTGQSRRGAFDGAGNAFVYIFHKGDLIFDMDVYTPVSCD
jgi:hypothetical protein